MIILVEKTSRGLMRIRDPSRAHDPVACFEALEDARVWVESAGYSLSYFDTVEIAENDCILVGKMLGIPPHEVSFRKWVNNSNAGPRR